MTVKQCFFLLTIVATHFCHSQNQPCAKFLCNHKSGNYLNIDSLIGHAPFINISQLTFDEAKAQRIIEQILCIENLSSKSYITLPYSEYNAMAIECDSKKYIFYNTSYLNDASDGNAYAIYGILAHEIAHHIRGDSWLPSSTEKKDVYEAELAADEYSGIILGRLGIPLQQALQSLSMADSADTNNHPAKQKREIRLTIGWQKGQKSIIPELTIQYSLNCQTNIKTKFTLGYDEKSIKKNFFTRKKRFSVHLETLDGQSLDDVDSVQYYLHPTTFKPNVPKPSRSRKNKFGLWLSIWGEFELRATVYLKDGRDYLLSKDLNLWSGRRPKG